MCDTLMRERESGGVCSDKKPTLESVTDTRESSLLHKKKNEGIDSPTAWEQEEVQYEY